MQQATLCWKKAQPPKNTATMTQNKCTNESKKLEKETIIIIIIVHTAMGYSKVISSEATHMKQITGSFILTPAPQKHRALHSLVEDDSD